jgi:hypothetical protein
MDKQLTSQSNAGLTIVFFLGAKILKIYRGKLESLIENQGLVIKGSRKKVRKIGVIKIFRSENT